jgi:hypothetical protein
MKADKPIMRHYAKGHSAWSKALTGKDIKKRVL